MNKEFKEKWVNALRSGEYNQGIHGLKIGDDYCCLGVLCVILGLEFEKQTIPDSYRYKLKGFNESCAIPPTIKEGIGLSYEQEGILMTMNDVDGATFSEIANYIEQNIPEDN